MMTNAQLATASLDDIVFDGRNRHYGAYELRALYQRHMSRALVIATAILALILVFPLVAQLLRDKVAVVTPVLDGGNILIAPPLTPDITTPPPPPAAVKPPTTPPQQPSIKDIVPVVVKNEHAPKDSDVPNQDDLADKNPGTVTKIGDVNANPGVSTALPPGLDDAVVSDVVDKHVYISVEHMPELPTGGGTAAIVGAIQRAVRYPSLALRNGVEGKVFVSFTVNAKGEVTDVKIVKGLGSGLDEETMRAIKTLPRFIPGKQNGNDVSVAFTVPVTYKIQ